MALVKEGLWNIVNGTERAPASSAAVEQHAKFELKRDKALATIVLSIEPSLLYLLGPEPNDPVEVWKKLADQFQKKTWANKLSLRRKLYALKLNEGQSVQKHIKGMTEIFDELAIIEDPLDDENKVVHLLASLPKSYDMLVTALEASPDVPKMEIVTERLLHEESKHKKNGSEELSENVKAMTGRHRTNQRGPKCFNCGKHGHIKKDCPGSQMDSRNTNTNIRQTKSSKKRLALQEENQRMKILSG